MESTPASASSPACALPPADITELQRRLVLSHMCGVGAAARPTDHPAGAAAEGGEPGPRALRRAQAGTIAALLRLLAHDALPVIPGQGSVGASGDLAPLAHVAAALIGVGRIRLAGRELPAAEALADDRPGAADAGPQGRAGAAQRHAGLDRTGDHRPAQGAAAVRRGADRRAPCAPMPPSAATRRSTRASSRRATSRARSRSRPPWRVCSPAARSALPPRV